MSRKEHLARLQAACRISSTLNASVYRMPRHLFPPAVIVLVFWLGGAPLSGSSHRKEPPPPAVGPEERIPVGPLGYRPPGLALHAVGKGVQLPGLHRCPSPAVHLPSAAADAARGKSQTGSMTTRSSRLSFSTCPAGPFRLPRNGGCMTAGGICGHSAAASFWCARRILIRSPTHR